MNYCSVTGTAKVNNMSLSSRVDLSGFANSSVGSLKTFKTLDNKFEYSLQTVA